MAYDCSIPKALMDYFISSIDFEIIGVSICEKDISPEENSDFYIGNFDIIITQKKLPDNYTSYDTITIDMTATLSRPLSNNKNTDKLISIYGFGELNYSISNSSNFNWIDENNLTQRNEIDLTEILFSLSSNYSIAIMPEPLASTYQITGTEIVPLENQTFTLYCYKTNKKTNVNNVIQKIINIMNR